MTIGRPKVVHKPSFRLIFQKTFNASFQIVVSYRQKKPKIGVRAKIFLQSFLPIFRVSVKSFIHLFLTRRATVQNISAFSKLGGVDQSKGANVSHNHLKI